MPAPPASPGSPSSDDPLLFARNCKQQHIQAQTSMTLVVEGSSSAPQNDALKSFALQIVHWYTCHKSEGELRK